MSQVLKIYAFIIAITSLAFALPAGYAYMFGEKQVVFAFTFPMYVAFLLAGLLWYMARKVKEIYGETTRVEIKEAFVAVGGSWCIASFLGSIPLWLSGCFASYADALFESVSGFTTTGASVVNNVEALPKCINLWRCLSHWLGGMGIIALVVALMPLLGVGGFRLIQAETTGPQKGKITTRMTNTAKVLWFIYCSFTLIAAGLLNFVGLDWYDSFCHAFTAISTGGFSTRNASVASFGSSAVEWICAVFMFLGSLNFALYFHSFSGRKSELYKDSELKSFIFAILAASLFITVFQVERASEISEALRHSVFQVVSVISTTGLMSQDYCSWKPASQIVIFCLFFVGGCSGSTSGGIKVVRWVVVLKQIANEFRRILHPHGVYTIRINGVPGQETLASQVATFILLYLLVAGVVMLAGGIAGISPGDSFCNALSMIGNIGPSFGEYGPSHTYATLPKSLKYIYSFAMLAGRLEIYTMLILVGKFFAMGNKAVK